MLKKIGILLFILFTVLTINYNVKSFDEMGEKLIFLDNYKSPSMQFDINKAKTKVKALDTSTYTSGNYKYTIKNAYRITTTDVDKKIITDSTEDIAVITEYTGTEEFVTIPTTLGGKRVGQIDEGAFYNNTSIKKLTIPNGTVVYIGQGAFAECTNLAEVNLGNSVQNISYYAFQNTALTSIKLPKSLEAIRNTTFFNCSKLKNITIDSNNVHFKIVDSVIYEIKNSQGYISLILYPYAKTDKTFNIMDGTKEIEYEAVLNDYVEIINIPASVTSISSLYTFKAKNLKKLNVNSSNTVYSSIDGVLFSKDKKILCIYPAGRLETTYNIPTGTTKISGDAFFETQNLKTINIPSTVNQLETEAFGYFESLENITIPSSVTKIGMQLFRECTNLKKVIVNANVETIPQFMFKDCENLEEVQLNGKIKKIEKGAFYYCFKLAKVTLPESLEIIEQGAFWCCRGLKNITIPKNVVLLEKCAFYEYQNYSKEYWADTVFDISQTELKKQDNGDYAVICDYNVQGTRDYDKAYEVLSIVNKERKNAGLNELTMDKDLLENAMLRAAELYIYYSHERPSGLNCFSAITKSKSTYENAGENIAEYQISATNVMTDWMNSEGHRRNILTDNYTCIGVGCFKGPNGQYHWVQIFTDGTPTTLSKLANKNVTQTVKTLKNRIPYPLKSISLNKTNLTLELGQTYLLQVSYNPENTTDNKTVSWFSSDSATVEVDSNGKITAKRVGQATIYAKVKNKVESCHVIVPNPTYPLQSINLNKTSSNLKMGETDTLKVTYNPSNTTDNKTVTWSSSNTKVATVDKTGTVKGVEEGTATITAKVGTKTASCKVTVEYKLPFKDVAKSDWFYEPVKWAYKNKVVTGYNETTFAPNDKTSRGQLVTILWRLEGKPDTSKLKNKFTDVPNTYYTEAIKWANSKGIVTGYGGTTKFGPEDRILRQDLALILMRYAKYKGKDTTKLANISNFADYKKAQNYAETALRWAVQNSIIQGNKKQDGTKTLDPQSNATRAEIVTMLMRYCQK